MLLQQTREWYENSAVIEGDSEIGAGVASAKEYTISDLRLQAYLEGKPAHKKSYLLIHRYTAKYKEVTINHATNSTLVLISASGEELTFNPEMMFLGDHKDQQEINKGKLYTNTLIFENFEKVFNIESSRYRLVTITAKGATYKAVFKNIINGIDVEIDL